MVTRKDFCTRIGEVNKKKHQHPITVSEIGVINNNDSSAWAPAFLSLSISRCLHRPTSIATLTCFNISWFKIIVVGTYQSCLEECLGLDKGILKPNKLKCKYLNNEIFKI